MVLMIELECCIYFTFYLIGLGYYSEQAMESQHHDFKVEWNNKTYIEMTILI